MYQLVLLDQLQNIAMRLLYNSVFHVVDYTCT